jgi:hypothetical protein
VPAPCNFPAGSAGPFQTITRALQAVQSSIIAGDLPPYVVKIAGRWNVAAGQPYVHSAIPQATPCYQFPGEMLPLVIPRDTVLQYDATNSEPQPGTRPLLPVVIEGPPQPTAVNTIEFTATSSQNFTFLGGLDGTFGGGSHGLQIRGGRVNVRLRADGAVGGSGNRMDVQIKNVLFGGRADSYDLEVEVINGATSAFSMTGCKVTTDQAFALGANAALVSLNVTSGTSGSGSSLTPGIASTVFQVDPPAIGARLPEVPVGIRATATTPLGGPSATLVLDLDSVYISGNSSSDPTNPQGLTQGMWVTSTGQTNSTLNLVSSTVQGCGVYGAQVDFSFSLATTVTMLDISKNQFIGNGPRATPTAFSAFTPFPGAGLLLYPSSNNAVSGAVEDNTFSGNVIGIALATLSAPSPPLSIARDTVRNQVLGRSVSMVLRQPLDEFFVESAPPLERGPHTASKPGRRPARALSRVSWRFAKMAASRMP